MCCEFNAYIYFIHIHKIALFLWTDVYQHFTDILPKWKLEDLFDMLKIGRFWTFDIEEFSYIHISIITNM